MSFNFKERLPTWNIFSGHAILAAVYLILVLIGQLGHISVEFFNRNSTVLNKAVTVVQITTFKKFIYQLY